MMNESEFLEFIYENAHHAAKVKVSGVSTILQGHCKDFSESQWMQFIQIIGSFGIIEIYGDFFSVLV